MPLKISTISSSIKKVNINTKCGSNKKIELHITNHNITKNNIMKLLTENIAMLSSEAKGISFKDVKINRINLKKTSLKRASYLQHKGYVMTNLYKKTDSISKFIITFNHFRDRAKFIALIES